MERGMTIYEKATDLPPLSIPAGNMTLGILLIDLRDLEAAEDRLIRSRDGLIALYGEQNTHVGNAWNSLGIVYDLSGDLVRARDAYERALAIQEAVLPPEHPHLAAVLHNLSLVSNGMGDTEAAIDFERRALAMSEKTLGADHQETLRGRHALGIYLTARGDTEQAERLLSEALAGRERTLGADHFDTAESLGGLADLMVDTGRAAEALPLLERGLRVSEQALGADHPIVALRLSSLSRCEARLGHREAARIHAERALAIRESRLGHDHPDVARNLDTLAHLHLEDGRRGEALAAARRAASLLARQARDTIAALPERRALLLVAGQPRPEEVLFAGLLAGGDDTAEWLAACWDWVLARRGAVLEEIADRNRRGLVISSPEAQAAWTALAKARTRLATLWVMGDRGDPEEHARALDAARKDREAAEKDLARVSPPYREARSLQQATPADLRAALPAGSALVEWVRVRVARPDTKEPDRRDIALLVGPADRSGFVDLGPSAVIDAAVAAWRDALASTAAVAAGSDAGADPLVLVRREGEHLRRIAFDPLRERFGDARRLFLVPDGAIHAVDFASLPSGDGAYVIDAGPAIQILSTGRDLVRFARRRVAAAGSSRGLLAIGGPDFAASVAARVAAMPSAGAAAPSGATTVFRGAPPACLAPANSSWSSLPAAEREARKVADLFRRREPALALTGAAASEDRFKREAPGRRVLHLATHGFFLDDRCGGAQEPAAFENPLLLSGLVLAGANRHDPVPAGAEDGVLTAEELAAIDLGGVDLVALSACDTGRGTVMTGEGVFGLRRALEIAGARSVLMSLWPVPDRASGRYMERFYRDRFAGTAAPEAARAAARAALDDLRRRDLPEHPYLWAGFITAGDWN
jgi:CHAT domain-containing protein/tetratricopeptide (TPR) repeat protein